MEQNHGKFRLKLNLFDTIVLVIALVVAAIIAVMMFSPKVSSAVAPQSKTVTYTIRLKSAIPETADAIEAGDGLEDAIKNLHLGEVVSCTSQPSTLSVLDEDALVYRLQPHPNTVDIDIVVTSPATIDSEQLLLSSSYRIRSGDTVYVRGPGYLGSGIILSIDRGIAE